MQVFLKIHPLIFQKILIAINLLPIRIEDFEPVLKKRGVKKISELKNDDAKKILSGLIEKLKAHEQFERQALAEAERKKAEDELATHTIEPPQIIANCQPTCPTCRCTWTVESYGPNASIHCFSCKRPLP